MTKGIQRLLLLGSALALAPAVSVAQEVNVGKMEFRGNCAVCHGESGKGDGPMAGYLTQKASDLTLLAKNNNGVFPFNAVYETIDGRRDVKGHGIRDMPVWGNRYNADADEYYREFPASYDPEAYIRGRILALTAYIYELQAK